MTALARSPGVSRSNLYARLTGGGSAATLSQGPGRGGPAADHHAGGGAAELGMPPHHGAFEPAVAGRRRSAGEPQKDLPAGRQVNGTFTERRIMQGQNPLLARRCAQRPDRGHDGKRVTLRRRPDALEVACWRGEIIRAAFIPGAHDRDIIAWRAAAGAGISGSHEADMTLEAVKTRFGGYHAPQAAVARLHRSQC